MKSIHSKIRSPLLESASCIGNSSGVLKIMYFARKHHFDGLITSSHVEISKNSFIALWYRIQNNLQSKISGIGPS